MSMDTSFRGKKNKNTSKSHEFALISKIHKNVINYCIGVQFAHHKPVHIFRIFLLKIFQRNFELYLFLLQNLRHFEKYYGDFHMPHSDTKFCSLFTNF